MMALSAIRQIRALLSSRAAPSSIVSVIREFLDTPNCDVQGLSEELTLVCPDYPHNEETFIGCLFVLHEHLPITGDGSIIQLWWDIVIRPALRDPSLPSEARTQAFAIILRILQSDSQQKLVSKFRVRLVDLWIHELPNDIEKFGLQHDELKRTRFWGDNLQQILLHFALSQPKLFLDSLCEAAPGRDNNQLSILLLSVFSHPKFDQPAAVVRHQIFQTVLSSPNQCLLLVPLLASLAAHSAKELKQEFLQQFIDILLNCFREDEQSANPRSFFTTMYYLFPCNTLNSLTRDTDIVRHKVDNLLRTHSLHSQLAWSSVEEEISTFDDPWSGHDVPTIMAESSMLDFHVSQASFQQPPPLYSAEAKTTQAASPVEANDYPESSELVLALQSQIDSMRLELSLVRWHQTHNRAHILRLFSEQAGARKSEHDWQSMSNELRNLRAQKDQDDQTIRNTQENYNRQRSHAKTWHDTLLDQNRELRRVKRGAAQESALLQSEIKELKAAHEAKDKRLAKTLEEVQSLKIARTEVQHKIDRLHDYEQALEKNQEMQLTWAGDFERFKQRKDETDVLQKRCQQLQWLQESTENAHRKLQADSSAERLRLSAVEAQFAEANRKIVSLKKNLDQVIRSDETKSAAHLILTDELSTLKDKNRHLEDSLTEIRASLELIKIQPGAVGRASPTSPFRPPPF